MELEVLEKEKGRLVFELQGATHTICNLLKEELWEDDDVSISAYNIDHPEVGVPKFVIETKKGTKSSKKALSDAIKSLKKKNKKFLKSFKSM